MPKDFRHIKADGLTGSDISKLMDGKCSFRTDAEREKFGFRIKALVGKHGAQWVHENRAKIKMQWLNETQEILKKGRREKRKAKQRK